MTVTAPAITSARLAVVRSTKAPTGVCAMIAAMPPTPITKPIEAWSQLVGQQEINREVRAQTVANISQKEVQ